MMYVIFVKEQVLGMQMHVFIVMEQENGIKLLNPYTVMLDNGGLIHSVVNGEGPAATEKGVPARLE